MCRYFESGVDQVTTSYAGI